MNLIGIAGLAGLGAAVMLALGRLRLQAQAGIADAAWSQVQAALEKRHELGRRMVANAAQPDDAAIYALHDVLTQAEFVSGFAMKARTENQLTHGLRDAAAMGGDERFAEAVVALPGAFEMIQRATSDYNALVRDYNRALDRQTFVARLFRYDPREELSLEPMEGEKS